MDRDETIVEYQVECPCGDSSDAYCEWADGHGHCFSCNKHFPKGRGEESAVDRAKSKLKYVKNTNYTLQGGGYRGFQATTVQKYGCKLRVREDGTPFAIQYPIGNNLKIRTFPKSFHQESSCANDGCFGISAFEAGAAQAVTIVEGEDDALAAYEMLGAKYPVVSIQSASTAKRDILNSFNWLNKFDKIYICFDNDEPGKVATRKAASLFDYNKVFYVNLSSFNDPAEYHEKGKTKEFVGAWWAANKFVPEGILASHADIDKVIDGKELEVIADYPFNKLQEMSFGIRPSEYVLVTADSGVGKTEFIRSMEHHIIKTTDKNVGIIHLEEEKERCVKGLVGYEMQSPIHLPNVQVDKQLIKDKWRSLVKRDHRVHLYSHFGSDDPDIILDTVRFMVSHAECRFVFLDHITMLVTGLEEADERKKLDYLSTKLGSMTRDHDFTLFLVSHINSEGGTHGSKNIHRVCDLRINLDRDYLNPNKDIRNKTHLTILKNRYGAACGPAGVLEFDPSTFILKEVEDFELPPIEE